MRPMNCKNCGAPLHNYKCDYCGTEYEKPPAQFIVNTCDTDVIACQCSLSLDEIKYANENGYAEDMLKHEMAYKVSQELLKYMSVDTWIDPLQQSQVFGGRIRVIKEGVAK